MDGWRLVGQYDSDVGSWLLHDGREAALLEVPEGLSLTDVRLALGDLRLVLVTASHEHEDHLDVGVWEQLRTAYMRAWMLHPTDVRSEVRLRVGGEPLWLVPAPKHSTSDVVAVFRGIAMTGDLELGTLDSVTDEVPIATRRSSFERLRGFEQRAGYRVHTVHSAHMDDLRTNIDWRSLWPTTPTRS
jgi:hydroxyacylglutathione hydrolase